MWHIMSHKVKLDRRSIKKRILQLDCAGKLPPHAGRLPAAVAARGVHQRGREVESAWLRPARRCVATAPWQECGEELAEREQRKAEVCQRKSLANGCRRSSP